MAHRPTTSFKTLRLLHSALLTGILLMLAVFLYLNTAPGLGEYEVGGGLFSWAVPLLLAAGMSAAYFISRSRLASAPVDAGLSDKMDHYRMTCILRWALVEGPTLVALIAFFLDENMLYLLYGLMGFAFLFLLRPQKAELQRHYRLSAAELAEV